MTAMANEKRCETCTEECAKSQMAHEAAVGRMYATKLFVALQKKIESGQLVEVVRCKDCEYSDDEISYLCCSHGVCVDCEVPPNFSCAEGKRKENDE